MIMPSWKIKVAAAASISVPLVLAATTDSAAASPASTGDDFADHDFADHDFASYELASLDFPSHDPTAIEADTDADGFDFFGTDRAVAEDLDPAVAESLPGGGFQFLSTADAAHHDGPLAITVDSSGSVISREALFGFNQRPESTTTFGRDGAVHKEESSSTRNFWTQTTTTKSRKTSSDSNGSVSVIETTDVHGPLSRVLTTEKSTTGADRSTNYSKEVTVTGLWPDDMKTVDRAVVHPNGLSTANRTVTDYGLWRDATKMTEVQADPTKGTIVVYEQDDWVGSKRPAKKTVFDGSEKFSRSEYVGGIWPWHRTVETSVEPVGKDGLRLETIAKTGGVSTERTVATVDPVAKTSHVFRALSDKHTKVVTSSASTDTAQIYYANTEWLEEDFSKHKPVQESRVEIVAGDSFGKIEKTDIFSSETIYEDDKDRETSMSATSGDDSTSIVNHIELVEPFDKKEATLREVLNADKSVSIDLNGHVRIPFRHPRAIRAAVDPEGNITLGR